MISIELDDGQQYCLFAGTSSGRVLLMAFKIQVGSVPMFSFTKSMWLRQIMTHKAVHTLKVRETVNNEYLSGLMSDRPEAIHLLAMSGGDLESWNLELRQTPQGISYKVIERWSCIDRSVLPCAFRGFASFVTVDSALGIVACDQKSNLYVCCVASGIKEWTMIKEAQSFASTNFLTGATETKLHEMYDAFTISGIPESQKSILKTSNSTIYFNDFFGTLLISLHKLHICGDLCVALNLTDPLREVIGMAYLGLQKNSYCARYIREWLTSLTFPIRGRREPYLLPNDFMSSNPTTEVEKLTHSDLTFALPELLFATISKVLEVDTTVELSSSMIECKLSSEMKIDVLSILDMIRSQFSQEKLNKYYDDLRYALTCILYCFLSLREELRKCNAARDEKLPVLFADLLTGVVLLFVEAHDMLDKSQPVTFTIKRKIDVINKIYDLSRLLFILRSICFRALDCMSPNNSPLAPISIINCHPDSEAFDQYALRFFARMLLSTFLETTPEDPEVRRPNVYNTLGLSPNLTVAEIQLRSRCLTVLETPLDDEVPMSKLQNVWTLQNIMMPEAIDDTLMKHYYCDVCMIPIAVGAQWMGSDTCIFCGVRNLRHVGFDQEVIKSEFGT